MGAGAATAGPSRLPPLGKGTASSPITLGSGVSAGVDRPLCVNSLDVPLAVGMEEVDENLEAWRAHEARIAACRGPAAGRRASSLDDPEAPEFDLSWLEFEDA